MTQWSTSGFSTAPQAIGFKSAGTFHVRVHRKPAYRDAGFKVHSDRGGLQAAGSLLPDGSTLAAGPSPQRSLDLSGFTKPMVSKEDFKVRWTDPCMR